MKVEWMTALWGGMLIGLSASIMLLFNGRVTGISGILYGSLHPKKGDAAWRIYFLSGLVMAGLTLRIIRPEAFQGALPTADWTVLMAGLLVGFGTVLGSGCTSGHGVCGISRLSPRSIIATVLFVAAGGFAVDALKHLRVLP